ncbi:preprotein translocase subunit YajC [Thermasporomyces composti]|jgi:preprotein translocase subunit YajC|uniref:Preprotein translocase subunit YajC n=1 Tax=Thermasporomyces composti TaxID=696763 RepID=A0A3D9VGG2_THECX|nr:preprotein translocase subunit YajC [Thermasporomyces composti]REF38235.1 preprotein translocase subunit YajC [Thermasporomyces composti]
MFHSHAAVVAGGIASPPSDATAATGGSVWALLLPILLLVLFWVVAIRPQRKRQRETIEMQRRVQPGQQVMTGAGLLATVHSVEDDVVVLEIAPGVHARYVRQAIIRIIEPSTGDGKDSGPSASSGETSS